MAMNMNTFMNMNMVICSHSLIVHDYTLYSPKYVESPYGGSSISNSNLEFTIILTQLYIAYSDKMLFLDLGPGTSDLGSLI